MVNWKKEFFSRCISKILFIDTEKLSKMHISLQVFFNDFGDRFGITYFEMMIMMVIMMMVNCFCGMVDQQKALRLTSIVRDPYHRNLQHAVSRTWTCTEPEFRLCWMKLCSSCAVVVVFWSYFSKVFWKYFKKVPKLKTGLSKKCFWQMLFLDFKTTAKIIYLKAH